METSTAPQLRQRSGFLRAVIGKTPTLLVIVTLGAAAWWGHQHGWSLAKPTPTSESEAWCTEHGVPDAICVECKPLLLPRPQSFGWCKIHGVSECPTCHPELAQVNGTLRLPQYDVIAAMNALPRAANDKSCKLHERRLQFASDASVKKAGLDIAVVSEGFMGEYVTANGEAVFDPTRVTRLSSPVPGRVVWVAKDLGQTVAAGELVALIDAADVGKAKTELLQAVAQKQFRARTLTTLKEAGPTVTDSRLREAEASVAEADVRILAAEQTLGNFGLSITATSLEGLPASDAAAKLRLLGVKEQLPPTLATSANLLPLRAPKAGMIVTRDAVDGEVVDSTKVLFVVADPTKLMLTLQVREEDARFLKLGQTVMFDDSKGVKIAEGKIVTLSPTIDDKTRTLPIRIPLDNPDGKVRNNTFGTGRVVLREEPNAIVVPTSAVHWDGTCYIVFVRDKHYLEPNAFKVFHVRKVVPGARNEVHTELLAGVLPGEVVVTKGSAALRAELLKANLGEG